MSLAPMSHHGLYIFDTSPYLPTGGGGATPSPVLCFLGLKTQSESPKTHVFPVKYGWSRDKVLRARKPNFKWFCPKLTQQPRTKHLILLEHCCPLLLK